MWQNGGHSGPDHWEFEPCLQLWNGKMYLQELHFSLVKWDVSTPRTSLKAQRNWLIWAGNQRISWRVAHLKNPEWKTGFLASFLDVRFPKREVGQKCSFSQGFKSRAKIAAMAAMTWFLFWLYFRTLEKVFDFLLDNGATEEMIQSFDLVTCVWVCLQWQSPVSYHRMPCFPSHKNSTRIWRNPIFPAALLNLNGDLGLGSTWKSFIFQ